MCLRQGSNQGPTDPLPYPLHHGVGESKLTKKLNVYNCKGDKSIPPHAN